MSSVGALTQTLAEGSYAAGWALVQRLPEPVARRLFQAGADLAVRRGGNGVDQLRTNLARVAPGQDLIQEAMRSYARYWCEAFRLPTLHRDRIVADTRAVREELLRASVAGPAGTILALSHSGNWDAAGAWLAATGVPFVTVAERLKPESLYVRFLAYRESLGMIVVPHRGGDRPPSEILEERLRAGGTIALVADRDLTPRGIDVQFFGATARMPAGPAKLALATGANLMPTTLSFTPDGWEIAFHDYIAHTDLATMTQQVATVFEAAIAEHPVDWHMLQRLWLDDVGASS